MRNPEIKKTIIADLGKKKELFITTSLLMLLILIYLSVGRRVSAILAPVASASNKSSINLSTKRGEQEQAIENPQIIDSPQRIYLPRWSTENGFRTLFYLHNAHISKQITARVSLVLAKQVIPLPESSVGAQKTVEVDIGQALLQSGEYDERSGAAIIDFIAPSGGALNARAQVINTSKSLSFNFPFMERYSEKQALGTSDQSAVKVDNARQTNQLNGVLWSTNQRADGYISLQNASNKMVLAEPALYIGERAISLGARRIRPNQALTINIPRRLFRRSNFNEAVTAGVSVSYTGSQGSLVAQGWVMNDENGGFSTSFSFHYPSTCKCSDGIQHLYGTGVSIGLEGGIMMGLQGVIFTPNLVLLNSSDKQLSVKPIFSYKDGDGVKQVQLPEYSFLPHTSRLINIKEFQDNGIIPQSVGVGNLDIQYHGEPAALIAELASLDQDGSFVSPVPLKCAGNRDLRMVYWRTDGNWHSSVTLQNIASEENDVEVAISYSDDVYILEKKIAPGEAIMISINELQLSQTPDSAGRRIPADAILGGMRIWSRNINNGLIHNAMLVDPFTKTCGECGVDGYVSSSLLSDTGSSSYSEMVYEQGQVYQASIVLIWTSGLVSSENANIYNSSNPSVGNGTSYGEVTASNPGSTTLSGRTTNTYPVNSSCGPGIVDASNTLYVFYVTIDLDDNGSPVDVTNPPNPARNVIVGQRINVKLNIRPSGSSATDISWTVPGTRFADWDPSADGDTNTAATVPLTDLNSTAVQFYWISGTYEGEYREVKGDYKLRGKSFSKNSIFKVYRPDAAVTSITGNVAVDSAFGSLELHFGSPGAPGIAFTRSTLIPSGFSGTWQWVQIAHILRRTKTNSLIWLRAQGTGLDNSYPYSINSSTNDSPATSLDSTRVEEDDSNQFEMWLMFRPAGSTSRYVPIRKVTWGYNGNATRSGATWTLNSSSRTVNPPDNDVDYHPEWTMNANSILFTPE
jgi:hypothetical protein